MPYIKQEDRKQYDEILNKLRELLSKVPDNKKYGHINYCFTYILKYLFNLEHGPITYNDYNSIIGVLECIKLEYYRKLVSEYEDEKIESNGEV